MKNDSPVKSIPSDHEHTASTFVRCNECRTWGNTDVLDQSCGNCGTEGSLVAYLSPCCVRSLVNKAELKENKMTERPDITLHELAIGGQDALEKAIDQAIQHGRELERKKNAASDEIARAEEREWCVRNIRARLTSDRNLRCETPTKLAREIIWFIDPRTQPPGYNWRA